jgi:hypothetical protein
MVSTADNRNVYVPTGVGYTKPNEVAYHGDKIIKKTPVTGVKVAAHKLASGVGPYTKKGLEGSRNSNFYEFLSMGAVPYILGSVATVGTYAAMRISGNGAAEAKKKAATVAAGVVLYGVGKLLGGKVMNKAVKTGTGIDLDMTYKRTTAELPEGPGQKAKKRNEYHKVFASADFFRKDLLLKKGASEGNRYSWYDKITKKMGYKDPINAPHQIVDDKIKSTIVKTNAAKSISSYLWAAAGVALGTRDAFGNIGNWAKGATKGETVKNAIGHFGRTFKEAGKDLMSTTAGKAVVGAAALATVLGCANVMRGFKVSKDKLCEKPKVDLKKEYEVV